MWIKCGMSPSPGCFDYMFSIDFTVSWISHWTKDSSSFLRCGMALPSLGWTFGTQCSEWIRERTNPSDAWFCWENFQSAVFLFFSSWTEEVDTSIKLARNVKMFFFRCNLKVASGFRIIRTGRHFYFYIISRVAVALTTYPALLYLAWCFSLFLLNWR